MTTFTFAGDRRTVASADEEDGRTDESESEVGSCAQSVRPRAQTANAQESPAHTVVLVLVNTGELQV